MKIETAIHPKSGRTTALMALLISLLSLYASVAGVFDKALYEDLIPVKTMTQTLVVGSRGQDIVFIPLALLLAFLSILFLIKRDYKVFITILGLTGNFLYGFALYAMQGQYTAIYLVYLLILGLSIYCMILGLNSFTADFIQNTSLSRPTRIAISIFLLFIVCMLGPIWVARLLPDIMKHIPQETYGVFVLDLGVVFPAIAIASVMLLRNKMFGNILAGVILVKAFTICLSWGFAEVYSRMNGVISGNYEMVAMPGILTLVSLFFFLLYLRKLKKTSN